MPSRLPALARVLSIALLPVLAGSAPAPPDARAVLERVSAAYRALDHYRIEGVVSVELRSAASTQSFDSPLKLLVRKPDRVASEMKNAMMGMQYVARGGQMVIYSEQLNQYTRRPVGAQGDSLIGMIPTAVSRYLNLDQGVKAARIVRSETLEQGGRQVSSTVVEVTFEHPSGSQQLSPTTFWIDAARSVVMRESLSVTADNPQGGGSVTLVQSTRYATLDLDPSLPDSLFAFHPPAGAKEVQQFGQPSAATGLEGQPAPDFSLSDLQGKSVRLSSLKGKVVLLDFWATWCGPCRIEMPRVQKIHKDFRTKGLAVYGVNVGEEGTRVKPFLLKNGYTFPILLDRSQSVMADYKVNGIPTLVIVDRKGTIRSYFVGVREDSVLRNALAALGIR